MKQLTVMFLALLLCVLPSCAMFDNYEFGDLSKAYCSLSTPELRAKAKAELARNGVNVGVDYCAVVNVVSRGRE